MTTQPIQHNQCDMAISLAFTVLGKRWNGLIIATIGEDQLSFVRLRRSVTGISDAVLSDRLSELVDAALVTRTVEPGPPVSVAYTLTSSGVELLPLLDQLGQWASSHLAPKGNA